jgi:hypothetical protein
MSNVKQTLDTMESAVQQQDTPLTVTLQRKGGRTRAQSMPRAQVILALIKKKIIFSSYIRKFRIEQLQSHL